VDNRQRSARVIDRRPIQAARPQRARDPDAPPQPWGGENDETCQRSESEEERARDDPARARGSERLARLPPLERGLLLVSFRRFCPRARVLRRPRVMCARLRV
jgi:hypothetical protein